MEQKRLAEIKAGDWYKTNYGEFFLMTIVSICGRPTSVPFSLTTGLCTVFDNGDELVTIVDKPDWALQLVDGEFQFDDEASSYELNETLNDMFPDVRITSERRPIGFFLCYKTTQAKRAEIRRTLGGS